MALNYFNPSDLHQFDATFNYVAKAGSGFAVVPSNEQVFITKRIVEQLELNIGDALHVWAVDNHASPDTQHFASRWRAVRVELVARIEDIVRVPPNVVVADTPKAAVGIDGAIQARLDLLRPWSVNELSHDISKARAFANQPDLLQRVGTKLNALHKTGDVACLKVYSKAENDRASAVYYAKNVDVFYDHLDTPLNDEEDE